MALNTIGKLNTLMIDLQRQLISKTTKTTELQLHTYK